MNNAQIYLDRYAYPIQLFSELPSKDLGIIVVIPCFNESHLLTSLDALRACEPTETNVEVITIINDGEQHHEAIKTRNRQTYKEAQQWAASHKSEKIKFLFYYASSLKPKHAGVGLARKIGMDEAIRRFEAVGKKGLIVCFDADASCEPSFLKEIERHFKTETKSPGASIQFEHPLEGMLSKQHYEGIVYYELFLRYYVNALRYAGCPYAFHTIGSSMAIRSQAYVKQGGMNRRKAGEDFYFLHKIIALGGFTEINHTKVIPSSRASDRVPFGTGRAIEEWLQNTKPLNLFYHPQVFIDLKCFIDLISDFYHVTDEDFRILMLKLPLSIRRFLESINFKSALHHITQPQKTIFKKHFFQWFDAFKCLKFVHYARDHHYENQPAEEAMSWLLTTFFGTNSGLENAKSYLLKQRELDQLGWHNQPT